MEQFYAYIYTDLSGKPFYVGKGKNGRAYEHLRRTDNHPVTRKIRRIRQDGGKPNITIIDCSSESIALELEKGLIRCIGRRDLKKGPLLNLTDGGVGGIGRLLTDEERMNLSQKMKGREFNDEWKARISAAKKGHKVSNETREKISLAKIGRVPWNKGKKTAPETLKKLSALRLGKKRGPYRKKNKDESANQ